MSNVDDAMLALLRKGDAPREGIDWLAIRFACRDLNERFNREDALRRASWSGTSLERLPYVGFNPHESRQFYSAKGPKPLKPPRQRRGKLTPEVIAAIRASDENRNVLAGMYGVTPHTISRVRSRPGARRR